MIKKGKGMDLRLLIQRDDVRLTFVIISTFSQDFKVPYKPILDSEVEGGIKGGAYAGLGMNSGKRRWALL